MPTHIAIRSAVVLFIRRGSTRRDATAVGFALALSMTPAAASDARAQGTVSAHERARDSVSFIVPRELYDVANAKVRSRDKSVALLLTDTTLVLQFTQRAMDRIEAGVTEPKADGVAARMIARMVGAGLSEFLDHGIAYRLSALRSARVEGSCVVLEDRNGRRVFDNVEVNGTRLLEDLSLEDARRFAADVNRAIQRLR